MSTFCRHTKKSIFRFAYFITTKKNIAIKLNYAKQKMLILRKEIRQLKIYNMNKNQDQYLREHILYIITMQHQKTILVILTKVNL